MTKKYWLSIFVITSFLSIGPLAVLSECCWGQTGAAAPHAPIQETKVRVLVPLGDIAPYHLFQNPKEFTLIEFPKKKLREAVEDTITNFDQIKGKQSRHYKMKAGEPFYKGDIADTKDSDIC